MGEKEPGRHGLPEALRRLAATTLAILQNRLELLVVELQEDRLRLLNALLLTAAIVALGFFTLAVAVSGLVVVVWHEFGAKGLFALSGVGFVSTLAAYWRLRAGLRSWTPYSETLAELKKDRECMETKE